MRKQKITILTLLLCMACTGGCGKEEKHAEPNPLVINTEKYFFDQIEKTDKNIPDKNIDKVETGIKNWAKATLGLDDSFSEESKEIMNEKLYDMIVSDEQRETVKIERENFYNNATISTQSIEVNLENTNAAQYNSQTIGLIECTVTIRGARNDEPFERIYDLILAMDYQKEIASVYEVGQIALRA